MSHTWRNANVMLCVCTYLYIHPMWRSYFIHVYIAFRHQATAVYFTLYHARPIGRHYNFRSKKKKNAGRYVMWLAQIRTVEFASNDISAGWWRAALSAAILPHWRWHFNLPAVKPTVSPAPRWQIIYCVKSPGFIPGHLPCAHSEIVSEKHRGSSPASVSRRWLFMCKRPLAET